MSYLQTSYDSLKRWEGSVPYMYLDSVGLVTVGIGFMLPNVFAASALPFMNSAGDSSAQIEIATDFARVKDMIPNKLPKFYYHSESPILPQAEIDRQLAAKVNAFEVVLRRYFPDYDAYPDSVKLGLIDMTYNLGPARFRAQYPKFYAAILAHNWGLAAAQSHRNGPSEERNEWCKNLFMEAV